MAARPKSPPLAESDKPTAIALAKLHLLFDVLLARGVPRDRAQRFTLQSAVSFFAQSIGLPLSDLLSAPIAIDPAQLDHDLLAVAGYEDWTTVHPSVLGALFQATMAAPERRGRGVHYTPDTAIVEYIIRPCVLEPWRARIHSASTLDELLITRAALAELRILDPACGAGAFLYAAYRELLRLDAEIAQKARHHFPSEADAKLTEMPAIRATQLFGIDIDPFSVELAKITLILAESLARKEPRSVCGLSGNLLCDDALFCSWPSADVILGNPPFQSKNKLQRALGPDYARRVRERYPAVPGRADYCVYWFYRAHEELKPGGRAGLVGTNTIRQNYSRQGGLDFIVNHGGTITEAVSTMIWPSDALVHVSVVNWLKGDQQGKKTLLWQETDAAISPFKSAQVDRIPASLSASVDVTEAKALAVNVAAKACYQGQTHGHEAFLLSADEARALCAASPANADVLFPYLIGEDLLTEPFGAPTRWLIDFSPRTEAESRRYKEPFDRILARALPDRERAANAERARNAVVSTTSSNRVNRHHERFLRAYWLPSYPRGELIERLGRISRYIACSRVAKRPIFAFVSAAVRPSDALSVFPFEDDYSFGVLQSSLHWAWLTARCSTLTARFRYTSETVFDTFPWPQSPTAASVARVAEAAVALRAARRAPAAAHPPSLRALYASIAGSAPHPLKDAHEALDASVRAAYGVNEREDPLEFLFRLNRSCAAREAKNEPVLGPGLPPAISSRAFLTDDAVQAPILQATSDSPRAATDVVAF